MQRIIFWLMIFTLVTEFCNAQNAIRLGIKGGVSIPNLKSSGDNPVSKGWSSRQGPYFGVVGEFGISKRVSIQAELNYAAQGGKKNGTQAISGSAYASYFPPGAPVPPYFYAVYDNEAKLNYLELPVMIKIDFTLGKQYSIFINGGPYAGFLLSAKNTTKGSSNVYLDEKLTQPILPAALSFDAITDVKKDIKNFNFGLQGGVGISLNFSNSNSLILSAGGNYGFIPIQKDEANGKSNTGAATVTLGYLFKL
ncbi:MAG: porin family protein [Panacibacter sp.]